MQCADGRQTADRQWAECYAQLVGTVLSMWDAAALDAANGEEPPATFINLADASIKMVSPFAYTFGNVFVLKLIASQIETLPIRNGAVAPLKNVLSLSSAGKNRYLLHFSSFHSMTQWTAAIRLAMYEHASLYEAYTGSLIAARGKTLTGIQSILVPTKFKHEDWARVRFGAGTPWRRCWFVINPPNEKDVQKARKAMKKSAYDRLSIPVLGNIQFFETKKTKKAQPIATITNVYSAYAIYPQSKALIEQSTLVKLEGRIHMHKEPQSSAEGLVFVMPELHAAVSGFETMLRFLFPTFDTFNLYGRPTRLIADTNHIKSIMFAFPKQRRYGYLDILDITNLLQVAGSQEWSEAEWRKQLKEAAQKRISTGRSRTSSVNSSRPRYRSSISVRNGDTPIHPLRQPFSPPESKPEFNHSAEAVIHEIPRTEPPAYHSRGMSDITGMQTGSRPGQRSYENSPHSSAQDLVHTDRVQGIVAPIAERSSSESDRTPAELVQPVLNGEQFPPRTPPSPVASPPTFVHGPRSMPGNRPEMTSEQRKANNRMSHATLTQLSSVGTMSMAGIAGALRDQPSDSSLDQRSQGQYPNNGISSAQDAYMSPALAHSSSDEAIGIAVPVRSRQAMDQRPATPSTNGTPSPQRRVNVEVSKTVKRKPLPQRQIFEQAPLSPDGEPSFDDLRHTLDEDALNQIAPHLPSPTSPRQRRIEDESVYDDAASTVSPDYASTHESVYSRKSQKSVTKPRMGVMKTVGMPAKQDLVIGDAHYSTEKAPETNTDIPSVDFGPTLTYMPTTGRPSTGDTLRKAAGPRNDLDAAERYRLSVPTSQMDRGHQRTPSQEEYRRSVLWQPGMATNRPVTPAGGLTPEQYVQQRAAPSPPMHMHRRSPSNSTPLQPRPVSGDWANQVRSSSRMTAHQDPNYRPSSRGTGVVLNNYNDYSNNLSAREQEHVARVTGSSFFNMSHTNKTPQPQVQGGGLVSTIDAREREKREMREGMSNTMVQHAIAHRQQVMNQQQQPYAPQYAGSMYQPQQPPQQPMYNLPGASHTWDALHQMNRPDEPRRSSWYGQIPQAAAQVPPSYQQSPQYPPGEYPHTYNAMRY
jgi:CCR4-NOT transcriptional complex subunit CAF120